MKSDIAKKVVLHEKKKSLVKMEAEIASIDNRIEDIQFQYIYLSDEGSCDELLDQRRRAIDKKKYLIDDVAKLRLEIMDAE